MPILLRMRNNVIELAIIVVSTGNNICSPFRYRYYPLTPLRIQKIMTSTIIKGPQTQSSLSLYRYGHDDPIDIDSNLIVSVVLL